MTSRSDRGLSPRAGVTLFETLVSLAIIALVLSVSMTALRGPSPALKIKRHIAEVQAQASAARTRAIQTGQILRATLDAQTCDGDPATLIYYPDGATLAQPLCLLLEGREITLSPEALTGRLRQTDAAGT